MLSETYNKHFYLAGRLSRAHAYALSLDAANYYLDLPTACEIASRTEFFITLRGLILMKRIFCL